VGYNGTTTRLWVNGASIGTSTSAYTVPTYTAVSIGAQRNGGAAYNGFASNIRFVKGTDVYGAGNTSITVPTAPLTAISNTSLLLNYTNGGITDATAKNDLETAGSVQISTTQSKFGTGSIYTGTTGSNYLRIPAGPLYQFGTENFTVEGWFLPTASGNERAFYIHGVNSGGGMTLFVGTGGVRFRASGTTDLVYITSISTFTHIAFVRDGNTRRIFIGGTQVASDTLSFNVSDNVVTDIGASVQLDGDTYRYFGYIDDLRITKGLARYTTTFTPPTQAFPTQ
jgi:hypothetical protein